jgi:hypothetical protein
MLTVILMGSSSRIQRPPRRLVSRVDMPFMGLPFELD